MKKMMMFMMMISLSIMLLACNTFRRINEEIAELDAEKDDVVMIGSTHLYKNGKDYALIDLFQEEASLHGFSILGFNNQPPQNHYPTYLDQSLYYVIVQTDHVIHQQSACAFMVIDLNTLDVDFIDFVESSDWTDQSITITTDRDYLLVYNVENFNLYVYHQETHELIMHTPYENSDHHAMYIHDGVIYFYVFSALPRIVIEQSYDYLTGQHVNQPLTSIPQPPVYGPYIEMNDHLYQLFPNEKNHNELYVYVDSLKDGLIKVSDVISDSDRGDYIYQMIKKRGHALIPGYVYVTAYYHRFYIVIQYDEGVNMHQSLFGKTPYLIFEYDYAMDDVRYLGSSSFVGTLFVDLHRV